MEIRDLLFDAGNRPHLAAHGISVREVREVVSLDEWVMTRHQRRRQA
ncbi:MAG: hypothetical protein HY332_23935 [Chloroflexi bacterium]|nr:hypothetical protein [Chloroflexota bacterium]